MKTADKEKLWDAYRQKKTQETREQLILCLLYTSISDQVLEFVMASPEVLLVSTPEPSSLTDAYSLLKALYCNPDFVEEETTIHIVTNRVNSRDEGQAIYEKVNSVVSKFLHGSLNYLGMIPQDAALERAVRQQKTVTMSDPNAKSAKAISCLTDHLLNCTQQKAPVRWGIAQMFSSFLSNRK